MRDDRHDKTIDRAAAFHSRVIAGDMTISEWRELEAWLEEDPEHRRTFEAMGAFSISLTEIAHQASRGRLRTTAPELATALADSERLSAARETRESRQPRSGRLAIAAGLLLMVLLPAAYFVRGPGPTAPTAQLFETAVAERAVVELEDGSSLSLNADSRVLVTYARTERRLLLERGEIDVDIVEDTARPFRVVAGKHVIAAVGTAFVTQYRAPRANLIVRQGRVQVAPLVTDPFVAPVDVDAGQALTLVDGASPVDLGADELALVSTWRDGWLQFDNKRLEYVTRELQPYIGRPIVFASGSAAGLEVSGKLNLDDADAFLIDLESLLPIAISDNGERILIEHLAQAPQC